MEAEKLVDLYTVRIPLCILPLQPVHWQSGLEIYRKHTISVSLSLFKIRTSLQSTLMILNPTAWLQIDFIPIPYLRRSNVYIDLRFKVKSSRDYSITSCCSTNATVTKDHKFESRPSQSLSVSILRHILNCGL